MSISKGRTLVLATEVHGLGAFCLRPTRCFRMPCLAGGERGKEGGNLADAGLERGEEAHI